MKHSHDIPLAELDGQHAKSIDCPCGTDVERVTPNSAIVHHQRLDVAHRSQVVVAYPDSSYKVRTYVLRDGHWDLLSEKPADPRSIAQATIAGRLAVAEVQG